MTNEELQEYARENRKRLEAQEVKLGDAVKVLIGQFAGEAGTVVGISIIGEDYADPYYEVNMSCEVPERYKCRKTLVTPNNIIGGLSASDFEVIGNRAPMPMNSEIKVGDIVVFKTDGRAFEIIGKYIVTDERLWRVEAIDENDPPILDRNRQYRLVAVDCPNVILDNIPERYIESYSAKLEREFEEQRIEELKKMKGNEIKVGDKVRVSKDAPKIYRQFHSMGVFEALHSVLAIEDDMALLGSIPPKYKAMFPTKYLVKVEDENKESMFKVGDKVRVKPDAKRFHDGSDYMKHYYWLPERDRYLGKVGTVTHVACDGDVVLDIAKDVFWNPIDIEPYGLNAPMARMSDETYETLEKAVRKLCEYSVLNDSDNFDWTQYEAELAKEVAVKIANKYTDVERVAEDAALLAKSVVENLKKK